MERLQSAIAKARASRQELTSGPASPAAAPVAVSETVTEAWDALREIPISDEMLIDNRIVSVGKGSEAIEFDKLRTRVLHRMQGKGWTRLAITSPGPSCGKSTIALNLGFGLARQEGARVMVIELDMRRPSFRKILGIQNGFDFSRALAGVAAPEDHLFRPRPNMAIGLTARVSESAELLQSGVLADAIDQIQARYQPTIIIFDLPPFKVSDDTMSFMDKTDSVMIIAAAGQTSIEDLDECERELASQTEVLGVVLNKCRHQGADSQYYYYG
ncbi:MAG: CpsD/CapB family tyrosine-protein kinase [Paracoccus sp. (in: a-proteobacteria)]|uniref:CpsD/CapB family tyrosine-protein kinase n=1 Tax=Paracoccus sp. TaxID=267 RepID=UPI0026DEE8DE|nr:CpsD/CapB family tyrosine-protein kinase [Paracoccus sp. (in: a-proteobacteria)]MDO5631463.1 CpsD/CapB family tyrosine-protein kinase [Paracoccus sp. (in: a-proteobacteria)]